MALIGYARVSTMEQDTALTYLRDGDVLAVWRLDLLGRSLPHLIETISALEARGVGFRSLNESIDTTTSGGRLIFHVFGALGQFERDLIRERTKAGLDAAGKSRQKQSQHHAYSQLYA